MAQDLWQIRRQKRMTIDELARRASVHPGLIKAYELGERTIPERDLEKLAQALEIDTWEIKALSDPPPRGPSRPTPPPAFGSETSGTTPSRPRYESNQGFSRFNNEFTRPNYDPEPRRSGFDSEPRRPSYDQDNRRSGYDQDNRRSGYDQDNRRPRYGDDQRRGGYGDDQRRGGYGDDQRRGGYGQDSQRPRYGGGDYGRQDYGSERRPSGGYGQDQRRGPMRQDDRPPYKQQDRRQERPRKKEGVRRRPQAAPARPSQIEHLKMLLLRLDVSGDELLRLAGKPLSMLNRKEAAQLLTTCQNMLAEQKPPRPKGKRQRPYLPESVDEHELVYLTEVQLSKREMQLTLFNGVNVQGTLLGFSPYALTLSTPEGQEVTLQKLAIAYYQVEPAPDVELDDDEEDE